MSSPPARADILDFQAKVTVSATVKPIMYLHFPDLDRSKTGKPEKLQIGYCYMPGLSGAEGQQPLGLAGRGDAGPESEIVRPLRVRNVSDRKLYLTCTPNLRKQCFVYAEVPSAGGGGGSPALGEAEGGAGSGIDSAPAAPRPPAVDLPLLPQSETALYIGLRPVLPSEAYTSG